MQGERDRYTHLRQQSTRLQDFRRHLTAPQPKVPRPGSQEEQEHQRSYRTPVERAEAEEGQWLRERKAARQVQAVWRQMVGPAPDCKPGDHFAAACYLERLEDARDLHASADGLDDGTSPLTRSEAAYLRLQISKWRRRATGQDPRFETHGTRHGRPRIR